MRSILALIVALALGSCSSVPVTESFKSSYTPPVQLHLINVSTLPSHEEKVLKIPIIGVVDDDMADNIELLFQSVDGSTKKIVIEIDSPGGSVSSGMRISRVIENSTLPVTCVVDGQASSMAFFILQSCQIRVMTERSILMAHEPSVSTIFQGKSSDWERFGKDLGKMLEILGNAMSHHMASRLNISYQEFRERIRDTEYWMDVEEAFKINAIDKSVKLIKDI